MKVENMSRRQRLSTPLPFAMYLLAGVLKRYGCTRVAVLWAMPRSNYGQLFPWVQLWTERNDALSYQGPYPIIAHPPCGCWGKYKAICKHDRRHGIAAMEMVHEYGGVVEQPLGSILFHEHGDGRQLERVNQCDYGHAAQKATLLYWV